MYFTYPDQSKGQHSIWIAFSLYAFSNMILLFYCLNTNMILQQLKICIRNINRIVLKTSIENRIYTDIGDMKQKSRPKIYLFSFKTGCKLACIFLSIHFWNCTNLLITTFPPLINKISRNRSNTVHQLILKVGF